MKAFFGFIFPFAIVVTLFSTIWAAVGHDIARFILSGPLVLIVIVGLIILSVGVLKGGAVALGLIVGLLFTPVQAYNNGSSLFKASDAVVEKTGGDTLSYDERVPYDVAEAMSSRSIGDTTGDLSGNVKSIPGEDAWNALIVRRGIFTGYESVQSMKLPTLGAASMRDVKTCSFSEKAPLRLGGLGVNNSIEQHAYRLTSFWNPTVTVDQGDAFAICDKDGPKLYLPMKRLQFSGLFTYDVPAGVVVYDGTTGKLTHHDEMKIDGLPVYPKSIAAAQRESVKKSEGFINWVMSRSGFDTTMKDEEDPNGDNSTEFALTLYDSKESEYVTPLTPRGSSSSIVALSTIEADLNKSDKLNQLVINKYENPREAPSTTEANIVSTTLSGYKASGLTVFEVIPGKNGEWVATIGKSQSILYRATINEFGEVTLSDSAPETSEDIGAGIEEKLAGDKDGTPAEEKPADIPAAPNGKKVADMTATELQQLADSITQELVKRAGAATPVE